MIERTNAAMRPSSPRSSRSSSTTARYSRSRSRVRPSTGSSSGCASTSTRRLPVGTGARPAADPGLDAGPREATARPPPGSRTCSTTSATVPTEANSSPFRRNEHHALLGADVDRQRHCHGREDEPSRPPGPAAWSPLHSSKFWGGSSACNDVSEYRDKQVPPPCVQSSRFVTDAREAAQRPPSRRKLVEPGMTIGLGSGRAVWGGGGAPSAWEARRGGRRSSPVSRGACRWH